MITILPGDCLAVMKTLAADSIDGCVTDPPYGIRFMGMAWDGKDIEEKIDQRRAIASADPGGDRFGRDGRRNAGVNAGFRSAAAEAGKYNRSSNANRSFQEFSEAWATEMFRILKPGAWLVSFSSTRTYHRMVCGIEDAGFEIRDQLAWAFGSGFPKSMNLDGDRDGWGTALKPGWEPICLARKPLVGTVADNVARFGTGALNIDGCRISHNKDLSTAGDGAALDTNGQGWGFKRVARDGSLGRWPANLTHDGSPDVVALFPAEAGAAAPVTVRNGNKFPNTYGAFAGNRNEEGSTFQGDSGSAARFFYCGKASRADRDDGCEGLPERQQDDSRKEGNPGGDNPRNRGLELRKNFHPTVKPTSLMRWLCRLITPPGGTIIDCFMGSGSTGRAAVLEGFSFVGIEMTADYLPIARARIAAAEQLKQQEDEELKQASAQQQLAL